MKYLYSCSFPVDNSGGKSRATFQKLKALRDIVKELRVVDMPATHSKIRKLLGFVRIEWDNVRFILRRETRPKVFISRGFCGAVSVPLARALGVFTVREVHADAVGEANLTPYSSFLRSAIKCFSYFSVWVDNRADIRIFNHPDLMAWYGKNVKACSLDGFSYNGADLDAVSRVSKEAARKKFDLDPDGLYLIFVGAASRWHGVDKLVSLQKVFNKSGDKVVIVCAGGKVSELEDPDGVLLNYSPMDAMQCADFIQAADVCLLTVSQERVSPGSPLKLYDYLASGKAVITQDNVVGYSDEVERYRAGICVDFSDVTSAREKILSFISSGLVSECERNAFSSRDLFSWNARMRGWVEHIELASSSSRRHSME